jgi:hypothetical protein
LDAGVVSFLDASIFREEWVEGKATTTDACHECCPRRLYGPARQPKIDYQGRRRCSLPLQME